MTPDEALDRFFAGEIPLFFLVSKDKESSSLTSRDFAREKRSEGLGILCWEREIDADLFLRQNIDPESGMRTIQLRAAEFDGLMDANDPGRADYDGFFCKVMKVDDGSDKGSESN